MSDEKDKNPEKLPTLKDMLETVRQQDAGLPTRWEARYRERFSETEMQGQERYARLNGLRDHYKHKGRWSNFLIFLMTFMVGFQSYLLFKVGLGQWDFAQYEWLLPALMVQNLAQVIGLAVFVVKALFADPK